MTSDKPSRNEEEYFAKLEAERLTKRREDSQRAAMDAERRSHFMKCPKCGADLATEEYGGIQIDRCPDCHGMWFDAGEAEALVKRESGGVISIFKSVMRGVGSR